MANGKSDDGIVRLRAWVQRYDWGRCGGDSQVARLLALNSGVEVDPKAPYAELWMGTHDSGPSFVMGSGVLLAEEEKGVTLKEWIGKNPNVLGNKVLGKWGCDLPFLFKVLSVAKALSIQAHPDKELAKELFKLQPHLYKDGNHKPEMALAITEFKALCGFISLEELKDVFHDVPEIVELIGTAEANRVINIHKQDGEEKVKSVLRSTFTQLMSANEEMTAKAISKLKSRLQLESKVSRQL
ncbi:hypothetical protein SLEP1_g27383 [Rubroshorea leprosula]|uniref:mannose-6-phosphate isomerase n=1 Tax=Rubroshorea leprosula TaxID=152421 RepID=A0AAV5JQ87_9ROSI|nr:hypothetical protein SLEP1_g27383 [Rubroshorea leprosula]